eukprot:CAMPEP_0173339284 /NCGR_PEP_ID=MMETSP1144-20121109/8284_1 /TAXON_ID=483371 /ORGANISM="non described non described, Strain CCMP2298" /LENGTH=423 /DNA_ID=CAMNT_0014285185 /DNA_START=88 /DNA_END=1356 /DNA_ORIENTATION=-
MDSELTDTTVERTLMRFNEIPKDRESYSFLMEIEGLSCWVLKFRSTGFILNNKYAPPSTAPSQSSTPFGDPSLYPLFLLFPLIPHLTNPESQHSSPNTCGHITPCCLRIPPFNPASLHRFPPPTLTHWYNRHFVIVPHSSVLALPHRELVCSLRTDATLHFTAAAFQRAMRGYSTLDEEVAQRELATSGSDEALASFRAKWLLCACVLDGPADMPVRATRLPELDKFQPLKAGWLLKKRDIFSGWRCRYFVVHADRLEYFIDQHDPVPKVTASLEDAEVQPVKRVAVHNDGEYWGIIVEIKNPKSTFRLASELTGVEGQVECATWEKVFAIARHACAQAHRPELGLEVVGGRIETEVGVKLIEQKREGGERPKRARVASGGVVGEKGWFDAYSRTWLLLPTASLLGVAVVYREAVRRLLRNAV